MKRYLQKSCVIKCLLIVLLVALSTNAMAQNITLKKSNVNLKGVIDEISKQSKMEFMYNNELISKYSVTVDLTNATLKSALDVILKNIPIKYSIKNGVVVLSPDSHKKIVKNTSGEEFTLRGKVISKDDKTTVPGATVIIDGTTKGAIIGFDGLFSLKVKSDDRLLFSFVGMKAYSYIVKSDDKEILIEMEYDNLKVDDVIVTGYGKIKSNENVGAVSKISGKDLAVQTGLPVEQLLQGKIAGMVVTSASGAVGTRQKTKVRGTSTLLGSQEPVWVVDGIIQEDPIPFKTADFNSFGEISEGNMDVIRNFVGGAISWLNPNDIQDITVLKDASATAIYGVKAANGVIVITTKRGREGKVSISYSGGMSVNNVTTYDKLNLMNSQERIDVSREIIGNGYISKKELPDIGYEGLYKRYMNRQISFEEFNSGVKELEIGNTNWLDMLMRTAISHNHSVSISGGSDRIQYYSSLYVNSAKGESKTNYKDGYGVNLSVSAWIIPDKLSVDTRLNASMSKTEGAYGADAYDYSVKTSRAIGAYNKDGSRSFYPKKGDGNDFRYNFMNEEENSGNRNDTYGINGSVNVNWTISKLFRFSTSLGYGATSTSGESYLSELTYAMTAKRGYEFGTRLPSDYDYKKSVLPHGGELNTSNTTNFNYTWRTQLDFNKLVGDGHRFSGSLGYEMRSNQYRGYEETLYGYFPGRGKSISLPPQMIMTDEMGTMDENSIYDSFNNTVIDRVSNYMSVYLAAAYSYKEKYTLSANVRSDASNRFGQNRKAAFLPVFSIGGRWNVAEEEWMKSNNLFNNLSLRASYGWQGNVAENFGPDLIAQIVDDPDRLTGEYVLKIKSLPYGDLRWEKVKTYNLGLDMGFLKNRLQVSFNYYNKKTEDMIVELMVPWEFGIDFLPINGGTMFNSGWDLTVMATPIRTDNFTWSLSVNTAKNNNKINSSLVPKEDWKTAVSGRLNKEGYPVSSVWGFDYMGVGANGAPLLRKSDPNSPGYNADDATTWMHYLGTLEPDFTGGLSTSLNYKSLTLSASFNMNIGAVRFLTPYVSNWDQLPNVNENMSHEFVDRWRKPGDEALGHIKPGLPHSGNVEYIEFARNQKAYNYEAYNSSNDRIVKANFFRCNNISLSYTFPERLLTRSGIGSLSVNCGMSNPFIIVSKDYKGVDPEVATGGSPIMKAYNFGLSLTF